MSILGSIDLSVRLERPRYRKLKTHHQLRLRELAYQLYLQKRSLVVVFEGWDASGKGGAIRRLTERLDPRGYQGWAVGPPEGEDATHHYLWRFWRRLLPPDQKQILIFDRSWYGRVLVERVEGFARPGEWKRAFGEINAFECQLLDAGWMLAKFWLHISPEEQYRRFQFRHRTPHKRWKLTDEDWRNREKWTRYQVAVEEMLARTSPAAAPWTIVEADDKRHARVKVLSTLVGLLEAGLDPGDPAAGEVGRPPEDTL